MTALIPFAIIGVCALLWAMLASRRFGHLFCVPAVGLLTVLASMILGRLTGASILVSTGVVVIVGGGVGVALATRAGAWRRPGRHAVAVWVPAMPGGAAWLGTLVIVEVLPGAAPLTWALNGDANDSLYFTERIIDQRNRPRSGREPRAAALRAARPRHRAGQARRGCRRTARSRLCRFRGGVGGASRRNEPRYGSGGGIHHRSIARWPCGRRQHHRIAAAAPLVRQPFHAGLPIEYGYLNAHVALPIVLAAWLIYLASPGRVVAALAVQFCIATLLLAT